MTKHEEFKAPTNIEEEVAMMADIIDVLGTVLTEDPYFQQIVGMSPIIQNLLSVWKTHRTDVWEARGLGVSNEPGPVSEFEEMLAALGVNVTVIDG